MSDAHSVHACENCQSQLQGPYCHVCGQHAHNPLKSLGHAIEEVFESFWHLDGRVFRTLRDLCVPGRIINNFLDGKRARYLPPLRIFVILSLFAFFLAHQVDQGVTIGADYDLRQTRSEAEVEQVRGQLHTMIDDAVRDKWEPGSRQGIAAMLGAETPGTAEEATALIDQAAEQRLAVLREAAARGEPPPLEKPQILTIDGKPWDAETNPALIAWAPQAFNAWLNRALIPRFVKNSEHFNSNPSQLFDAWLSAIPTALFFLVPVFALLLRLAHPFSKWTYLEHLVVALYMHAFILLGAIGMLLLALLAQWTHSSGLGMANDIVLIVGIIGILIWLLITRRRVYRQPWWISLPKFLVVGSIYTVLVSVGAMVALFAVFLK